MSGGTYGVEQRIPCFCFGSAVRIGRNILACHDGEYILYHRGKIAAYICDDRLLVKPVEAAKKLMPDAPMEPPYEGAKNMLLVENVDDREFLTTLFETMFHQLPEPKSKK